MRRWPMEKAPRDGTTIIGCTRVEGVEHAIRWQDGRDGAWIDARTGDPLDSDLFVEWRKTNPAQ